MIKHLTMVVFLMTYSLLTHAASFNCGEASSYVEKTICSDKQLSDIDTELANYYRSILDKLSAYPEDKGNQVIPAFQKAWLGYRNLCQTKSCIYDLYAMQLSDLYINHVSVDGSYYFFEHFNGSTWLTHVLGSYGVKRGINLTEAISLLAQYGWSPEGSESSNGGNDNNDNILEQVIQCGSGLQAICHVSFTTSETLKPNTSPVKTQHFELIVFLPNDTWLIDTNNSGFY